MPRKKLTDGLDWASDFLNLRGWNVIVIGPARIQQAAGARKFCYELVISFTGKHTKSKEEDGSQRLPARRG